jgi:hypothetical protein
MYGAAFEKKSRMNRQSAMSLLEKNKSKIKGTRQDQDRIKISTSDNTSPCSLDITLRSDHSLVFH